MYKLWYDYCQNHYAISETYGTHNMTSRIQRHGSGIDNTYLLTKDQVVLWKSGCHCQFQDLRVQILNSYITMALNDTTLNCFGRVSL